MLTEEAVAWWKSTDACDAFFAFGFRSSSDANFLGRQELSHLACTVSVPLNHVIYGSDIIVLRVELFAPLYGQWSNRSKALAKG